METFTKKKDLLFNPQFEDQRLRSLQGLRLNSIDPPIRDIVSGFAQLTFCFTLQSCYGHFLFKNRRGKKNINRLPSASDASAIEYRIAYLAICIQDSVQGRNLLINLAKLVDIDPNYVQFGCADWFWQRQINSYVLQVEPERDKTKDRTTIYFREAQYIEKIRDEFFERVRNILKNI